MVNPRGPSRAVRTTNIDGTLMHAEAQYIANASDISSMGSAIAASGYSVSGVYVHLTAGLNARRVLAIQNNGTDTLFIGPSGNGVANMFPIAGSGGQLSLNVTSGVQVYGLTDGTQLSIRVLELA